MVIRLSTDQIALYWDTIKFTVQQSASHSGDTEGITNSVLANLLSGKYQCWVMYSIRDEQRIFHALCLSSVVLEPLYDLKQLWIGCIYGFRPLDKEIVDELDKAFIEFGKANDCNRLIITSKNPRVAQFMEMVDAEVLHTAYVKNL